MENYNLHRRAQSGWHPTTYSRKPTPDAPRERNYAAILAAAKRPPVGYWADAPMGIQFGGGAKSTGSLAISSREGQPSAAPSSAAWPAYTLYFDSLSVWSAEGERKIYWKNGEIEPGRPHDGFAGNCGSRITQAQFIAKLREWNHPALAEFEAQPRKRVEGRVWKNGPSKNAGETKYEHWRSVLIGGRIYSRGAWNKEGVWSCESNDIHEIGLLEREFIELHGPEADAIIRECAKAMGLDHGTR